MVYHLHQFVVLVKVLWKLRLIHHRQNFVHKGINITYCGSFIQQDFGERVSEHGYLIWDVEHLDYTEHDIDTEYGYYVFKINSLEDLEVGKEYLTNA